MAMTARDLVVGYAHDLGAAREAMRAAVPGLDRLADLLGLVRSHRIGRRGEAGPSRSTRRRRSCVPQ
ncbi:hypothetical protein [Streptomyces cyaneofuscatus]